jgi:hypothetical protein
MSDIAEINYSVFLAVSILMVCVYYLGNVAIALYGAPLSETVIYGIRYISAPLCILSCLLMSGLVMSARTHLLEREASLEKFAVNSILLARSTYYNFGEKGQAVHDALQRYIKHLQDDRPLALIGSPSKKYSEPLWRSVEALPENSITIGKDSHFSVTPNENYISNKNLAKEFVTKITEARMELAAKQMSPVKSGTVLLVCLWFSALFFSLGLTSPFGDRTVLAYGIVAALCVASAVLLLAEYSNPTTGWIQLSSRPLQAVQITLDETN